MRSRLSNPRFKAPAPATWLLGCCLWVSAVAPAGVRAQEARGTPVAEEVFADSEAERYLRVLQLTGEVPLHPWSVRAFSTRELERLAPGDSLHPWAGRYDFERDSGPGPHFRVLRPSVGLIYNTTRPYGRNDGAVWAGRGLTSMATAGVAARWGPVSLTLAPVLFRAENQDFELEPNGQEGLQAFGDLRYPGAIDRPRRFGDAAYSRVDPGQSTLRVDLPGLTAGVSTANQFWGPAVELPLMLGVNAGGFRHAFLGTSTPVPIFLGRVHGRVVWGRLDQSAYSSSTTGETRRLFSGLIVEFSPRGLDGLEIGVSRIYHIRWPDGGPTWEHFRRPLEPFLKIDAPESNSRAENQLAALFGRWALPAGGVEVYGEYARDDHSWDQRDLLLEPDHSASYLLGVQKVWARNARERVIVGRAEWTDARRSHLLYVRNQARLYAHQQLTQGHTQRGQLLGSEEAFAGSGAAIAVDVYGARGRTTAEWRITDPQERNPRAFGVAGPEPAVSHALRLEALRNWRGQEVRSGATFIAQLDPSGGEDRFGLRLDFRVTADWSGR